MFLETQRLILRKFEESDFDDFCAFAMDDEMCRMMGRALMPNRAAARVNFGWLMNHEPRGYVLELKESGRVIGNLTVARLPEHIGRLEALRGKRGCALSFSIGRDHQRKGLMLEAVRAVIDRLFEEGMEFINCGHFDFNIASRALQEKLGFEHLLTETVRFGEEEIVCVDNILWNTQLSQGNPKDQ